VPHVPRQDSYGTECGKAPTNHRARWFGKAADTLLIGWKPPVLTPYPLDGQYDAHRVGRPLEEAALFERATPT